MYFFSRNNKFQNQKLIKLFILKNKIELLSLFNTAIFIVNRNFQPVKLFTWGKRRVPKSGRQGLWNGDSITKQK